MMADIFHEFLLDMHIGPIIGLLLQFVDLFNSIIFKNVSKGFNIKFSS